MTEHIQYTERPAYRVEPGDWIRVRYGTVKVVAVTYPSPAGPDLTRIQWQAVNGLPGMFDRRNGNPVRIMRGV